MWKGIKNHILIHDARDNITTRYCFLSKLLGLFKYFHLIQISDVSQSSKLQASPESIHSWLWQDAEKSASIVLVSLRSSTYPESTPPASLAAALLDSLFEHPAALLISTPIWKVPLAYSA
jgi:cytoplasmic iron level regulating protein YaaA (DUF328/UPF0246 family)